MPWQAALVNRAEDNQHTTLRVSVGRCGCSAMYLSRCGEVRAICMCPICLSCMHEVPRWFGVKQEVNQRRVRVCPFLDGLYMRCKHFMARSLISFTPTYDRLHTNLLCCCLTARDHVVFILAHRFRFLHPGVHMDSCSLNTTVGFFWGELRRSKGPPCSLLLR